MKNKLFFLCFILVATLSLTSGEACYEGNVSSILTNITPSDTCLEIVDFGASCDGPVYLHLKNLCNESLIYEKEGSLVELVTYEEYSLAWEKYAEAFKKWWETREGSEPKLEVNYEIYDRNVPQDYVNWSKVLYYKNNPDDKIIINLENYYVEPKNSDFNGKGILIIIFLLFLSLFSFLIPLAFIVVIVVLIIYFIRKKKKSSKKKKK